MRHLGAAMLTTKILFWWTESGLLKWSGSIKYGVIGVKFNMISNGRHIWGFAAVDLKSITNLGAPKCPKLSYSGISKFFYDIQVACF